MGRGESRLRQRQEDELFKSGSKNKIALIFEPLIGKNQLISMLISNQ